MIFIPFPVFSGDSTGKSSEWPLSRTVKITPLGKTSILITRIPPELMFLKACFTEF
jgi:hypothetical protein